MFKKLFQEKKAHYQGERKTDTFFSMDNIYRYYEIKKKNKTLFHLSDQSCYDLGLDDFFMFADRTCSPIGQQYLYNLLRSVPEPGQSLAKHETLIEKFNTDTPFREKIAKILLQLHSADAYGIASLIDREYNIPKGYSLFRILAFLPVLSLILAIISESGWLWILFICSTILNGILHYRNKSNTWGFISSLPQLVKLLKITEKLTPVQELKTIEQNIEEAYINLKPIRKHKFILMDDSDNASDLETISWVVREFIYILTLAEPITYIKFVRLLKDKQNSIEKLFRFIGLTDTLLSVSWLRKDLPYYCQPGTPEKNERIIAKEIYHPLINNCISNNLTIGENSILLTGTNMSGKTTFIRTVGLNILAAQTLNTAFAQEFRIKLPLRIFSALMISDNLSEGTSSYLQEIKSIHEMISHSMENNNLFLMDEICKGTNTKERIAVAHAILQALKKSNNLIFVSTHDIELAELLNREYDLYHFCENLTNNQITFDYKLKSGKLKTRNAIRILGINGYPDEIIQAAYKTYDYLATPPTEQPSS